MEHVLSATGSIFMSTHTFGLFLFTYLFDLQFAHCMNRGWRMFMIKLWNHSLLSARTMDTCNRILDDLKNERSDPKKQWREGNIGQLVYHGVDSDHFKVSYKNISFLWSLNDPKLETYMLRLSLFLLGEAENYSQFDSLIKTEGPGPGPDNKLSCSGWRSVPANTWITWVYMDHSLFSSVEH